MVPKILNCRFALISALAVLGAVTFAPKASATDQTITFNGTVGGTCTFATPVNGVLQATALKDGFTTLTPGTVQLTCNSPASTLQIFAPAVTSGQTLDAGATLTSQVSSTTITTPITNADGATTVGILTGEALSVAMALDNNAAVLADGNYTFTVLLTALPN